jgi:hypothetical protein
MRACRVCFLLFSQWFAYSISYWHNRLNTNANWTFPQGESEQNDAHAAQRLQCIAIRIARRLANRLTARIRSCHSCRFSRSRANEQFALLPACHDKLHLHRAHRRRHGRNQPGRHNSDGFARIGNRNTANLSRLASDRNLKLREGRCGGGNTGLCALRYGDPRLHHGIPARREPCCVVSASMRIMVHIDGEDGPPPVTSVSSTNKTWLVRDAT